jgi:hypothetical protein
MNSEKGEPIEEEVDTAEYLKLRGLPWRGCCITG